MIETINDYNSFWLIIFAFLTIVTVVIGLVLRGKSGDKKDTDIFFKSSDNAKEVTLDNNKTHVQVIEHLPPVYEKELHSLEKNNKRILDLLEDINKKVDMLLQK